VIVGQASYVELAVKSLRKVGAAWWNAWLRWRLRVMTASRAMGDLPDLSQGRTGSGIDGEAAEMRGLLIAIAFCGVSLLFAESATTLLMHLQVICSHCHDQFHDLIMLVMLIGYVVVGPVLTQRISDSKK